MTDQLRHIGLFEGIGGFSLAARWAGWETLAWCEINPFCQKVLKQHFPNAEALTDVTKTDFTKYANRIDILTGGFPCQTFSVAGKGEVDLTLWKEMYRAIKEAKPSWVVAENVPGIIGRKFAVAFETVCTDLEHAGYEVQTFNIPIAGKGAPHKRERIWFIAHSDRQRCKDEQKENRQVICNEKWNDSGKEQSRWQQQCGPCESNFNASDLHGERFKGNFFTEYPGLLSQIETSEGSMFDRTFIQNEQWESRWPEIAARFCRMDDGVSNWVDRIKACGNALSPHIAFEIFKTINACHNLNKK